MLDYIFEEIGAKIGECRMAIPKIVHYCWFGGKEKPDDVKKCIKSWKQHLSDYRFMEWNEKNFDINNLQYTKEAYHAKNMHLSVMLQELKHYISMVEFIWIQMWKY